MPVIWNSFGNFDAMELFFPFFRHSMQAFSSMHAMPCHAVLSSYHKSYFFGTSIFLFFFLYFLVKYQCLNPGSKRYLEAYKRNPSDFIKIEVSSFEIDVTPVLFVYIAFYAQEKKAEIFSFLLLSSEFFLRTYNWSLKHLNIAHEYMYL